MKNCKASSDLERLFEGKQRVKRLEVEQNLNKLLKVNNIENVYLCVQLWICLVLTNFLIPNSSCAIPTWMLRYLQDIDQLANYNWAKYTYDVIMDSINNLKSYCLGCSWALLVSIFVIYIFHLMNILLKYLYYSPSL